MARPLRSLLGICGLFLGSALLAMPPRHPGSDWAHAHVLRGAAIYGAMAILGALCSLLATALALSAPHFASGLPRQVRLRPLLLATAPLAGVPLAALVVLEAQSWAPVPAAAGIAGSIVLASGFTAICARAYARTAAAAGARPRWKPAIALLALVAAFVALLFAPIWLVAAGIPVGAL